MSAFINVLLVFLGGGIGASLRYGITLIPFKLDVLFGFPLLTFLVNFIGSYIIGVVSSLGEGYHWDNKLINFVKVGILGGFTTFSSFALDSVKLFEEKKAWTGIAYILLSVSVCLAGCFLGQLTVRLTTK